MIGEPAELTRSTDSEPDPALATTSATEPGADPLRVAALVGQSVYDERNRRIGIIEHVAVTRERGLMCTVTGAEGYLGSARIPLQSLTLIGDKLHRNSLASRLHTLEW